MIKRQYRLSEKQVIAAPIRSVRRLSAWVGIDPSGPIEKLLQRLIEAGVVKDRYEDRTGWTY